MKKLAMILAFLFCIIPSMPANAGNGELRRCGVYQFIGILSTDLQKTAELQTFNENGVAVSIKLQLPAELGLKAMNYSGQTVMMSAQIEKTSPQGEYMATGLSIKLAPPLGLDSDPSEAKFIRMQACTT